MSAQITAAKALEYINNYRVNLPPGSLKSGWIDQSFIDAIMDLSTTHTLNGVRIYLARYTENISREGFAATAGSDTIIIVPTVAGNNSTGDDLDAYYDYAHICPPHCDGDIGD